MNAERAARRVLARSILVGLVVAHAIAVCAYWLQNRQQQTVVRTLEARSAWREGHLDDAAFAYRRLLAERDRLAFPVILVRNFPARADLAYLLGRVETERRHTEAALDAYEESVREGGRGAREYRDLLLQTGRAEQLLQSARQEHDRNPASPQPLKDEGAALLALHRPAEARVAYAAALQRLPDWRRKTDPGAPPGLSGEEADLLNLSSAAALLAGDFTAAEQTCAAITSRQSATTVLDQVCRALLADHAGRHEEARRLLRGYLPAGPEHEMLLQGLLDEP